AGRGHAPGDVRGVRAARRRAVARARHRVHPPPARAGDDRDRRRGRGRRSAPEQDGAAALARGRRRRSRQPRPREAARAARRARGGRPARAGPARREGLGPVRERRRRAGDPGARRSRATWSPAPARANETITSGPLLALRAAIAAAAVLLFLLPIATPPGIAAGIAGTLLGYLLARVGAARGLRLPAGLLLGALAIAFGYLCGQWPAAPAPAGGPGAATQPPAAPFSGPGCLGGFFGICLLGQRARVFSVIELVAVVGAVAHPFSAHRHHHIHEPRFLSDWAWS